MSGVPENRLQHHKPIVAADCIRHA
jgi:hypothetical protein